MKKSCFTLIEVLIALSILVLGVLALVGTISAAQRRILNSNRDWRESHLLIQAAEFYSLAPPGETMPDFVFDSDEYRATAEYLSGADVLPVGISDLNGQWRFVVMEVELKKSGMEAVRSLKINRIINEGRP